MKWTGPINRVGNSIWLKGVNIIQTYQYKQNHQLYGHIWSVRLMQ